MSRLSQGQNWLLLAVGVFFGVDGGYRVVTHDFTKTLWLNPVVIYGIVVLTLILSFATFAKTLIVTRKSGESGDLWVPICAVLAVSQIERLVGSKDEFEWGAIVLCLFSSGVGFWIAFRNPKKWEPQK